MARWPDRGALVAGGNLAVLDAPAEEVELLVLALAEMLTERIVACPQLDQPGYLFGSEAGNFEVRRRH